MSRLVFSEGIEDWIVAAPVLPDFVLGSQRELSGPSLIEQIRMHAKDLDVVGSYPWDDPDKEVFV